MSVVMRALLTWWVVWLGLVLVSALILVLVWWWGCAAAACAGHHQACTYHPGKFLMSCPKDCAYHKGGKPAYSCRAHYRWRWSCCGKAKDEPFMGNGCQNRFHVAGKDALYVCPELVAPDSRRVCLPACM